MENRGDRQIRNNRRLSFALAILTLLLASFLSSLISTRVYRPMPEAIVEVVSKSTLDSQELSFSAYRLTRAEPKSYISKVEDSRGQSYYLSYNWKVQAKLIVANALILLLAGVVIYRVFKDYRKQMRDLASRPIVKLTGIVTNILSGASKEADLDRILEEVIPLIDNGIPKAKLEESLGQLFMAEKQRREFTANVTHELKTPLTSINGYAEIISSGLANEEDKRKFADIILAEGNRLLNMIDEIIRLSQYETKSYEGMDFESFDLGQLAKKACAEMRTYGQTKGVDISCFAERVMVRADEDMIYEMITNLISNGIKYNTPPGSVQVIVKNAYPYGQIQVADDGIGISQEDQARVFERFYMVNRNNRSHSGTGLGLSLVKHIVEKHEGKIQLKSSLGSGSSFTIWLPMD